MGSNGNGGNVQANDQVNVHAIDQVNVHAIDQVNVHAIDHPIVADALRVMRSEMSSTVEFRTATRLIARALAYEATRRLPLAVVNINTPLEPVEAGMLADRVIATPIHRAGLGMLDGFLDIVPTAAAGFIGLKRNEQTLLPYEYYRNLPSLAGAHLFILDPMLATGGSVLAALDALPQDRPGELPASISLLSIIAAPEGVRAVTSKYPSAAIHIASIDR